MRPSNRWLVAVVESRATMLNPKSASPDQIPFVKVSVPSLNSDVGLRFAGAAALKINAFSVEPSMRNDNWLMVSRVGSPPIGTCAVPTTVAHPASGQVATGGGGGPTTPHEFAGQNSKNVELWPMMSPV